MRLQRLTRLFPRTSTQAPLKSSLLQPHTAAIGAGSTDGSSLSPQTSSFPSQSPWQRRGQSPRPSQATGCSSLRTRLDSRCGAAPPPLVLRPRRSTDRTPLTFLGTRARSADAGQDDGTAGEGRDGYLAGSVSRGTGTGALRSHHVQPTRAAVIGKSLFLTDDMVGGACPLSLSCGTTAIVLSLLFIHVAHPARLSRKGTLQIAIAAPTRHAHQRWWQQRGGGGDQPARS